MPHDVYAPYFVKTVRRLLFGSVPNSVDILYEYLLIICQDCILYKTLYPFREEIWEPLLRAYEKRPCINRALLTMCVAPVFRGVHLFPTKDTVIPLEREMMSPPNIRTSCKRHLSVLPFFHDLEAHPFTNNRLGWGTEVVAILQGVNEGEAQDLYLENFSAIMQYVLSKKTMSIIRDTDLCSRLWRGDYKMAEDLLQNIVYFYKENIPQKTWAAFERNLAEDAKNELLQIVKGIPHVAWRKQKRQFSCDTIVTFA